MGNTVYVCRIGPVDAELAPGLYSYVTFPRSEEPIFEEDVRRALDEVVRRFPTLEPWCEPDLAEAGAALGFRVREPTVEESISLAILWLDVAQFEWYRGIQDVGARIHLLRTASAFWTSRGGATDLVHTRVTLAGKVDGHRLDGTHYVLLSGGWGVLVFETPDEMDEFQRHLLARDNARAVAIRRLQVHGEPGPAKQQAVMSTGFGTEKVPIVSIDHGLEREPVDDRGAWIAGTLLAAVTGWLSSDEAVHSGTIDLVKAKASVEVAFLRAYVDDPVSDVAQLSWADYTARRRT